jgi:hypothetical protein
VSIRLRHFQEFSRLRAGRAWFDHPGEDEQAGGDTGRAENDKPRVGLVEAEHAPAEQLAEDEQPGAGRDAGGVIRSICHPDRGRDLQQEGDGQGGAQAGAPEQRGNTDQQRGPYQRADDGENLWQSLTRWMPFVPDRS